jgi:hypothetical protein
MRYPARHVQMFGDVQSALMQGVLQVGEHFFVVEFLA